MKVIANVPALITLGTLYTIPHGSLGQPGADGGGGGLPGSNESGGGPPGGVSSSDDANNVYCEEDGSSAHYEEIFSGSGSAMMRYGGSHTGCPNHVNWDINPNSAQHNPTNTSIPAYPLMLGSGGTTDLSSSANAVGIMRNGVVLFSAWARDQVLEYEDTAFYLEADSFDLCGGHSTTEGTYHYHGTAGCLQEQAQLDAGTSSDDHSALLGWAYDGFPVYGQLGPDGVEMKMCGLDGADATRCLDVCSGYEALIPDVDDFAYRYYTSCGFDESFFPFTTNCFRGCCPEGVTCSEKVEPCGDSPENGYTADYVPTIARSLDDQYDANLIAGDDTDFIDSSCCPTDVHGDGVGATMDDPKLPCTQAPAERSRRTHATV
eukprot:jgi/Undpi1/4549/HiC_scaffold_18.g07903.m1